MNITDKFIDNILSKRKEDIPERVYHQARRCFLDYLGVAIAGAKISSSKENKFIELTGESGRCHVIGLAQTTSPYSAALLNGISAHTVELDDGHRKGMIHLGAPIISSMIAVNETHEMSTIDFLYGVIIGYEAAVRMARTIQPSHKLRGYHVTGTCGTIGAAFGIATALDYNKQQIKAAISAAVSSAAGVLEIQEDDSELKPYNAGRAAVDGLISAIIGYVASLSPKDPIGGKRGFINVMSDESRSLYLTDESDVLQIEQIYQKPYVGCRHSHSPIEAALYLKQNNDINTKYINKVLIDTYNLAVNGHDYRMIDGVNSAKMSTPFLVASALINGRVGLEELTEESIHNEEVVELTNKVVVRSDDELSLLCPERRAAILSIIMDDGKQFSHRVDYPKGEPENPISDSELEDKFRQLASFTGLSDDDATIVIDETYKENIDFNKIFNIVCR